MKTSTSGRADVPARHQRRFRAAQTKIQAGIELAREQDAAKAAEIEAWLELVASAYNVLAMDGAVFRQWARLMHRRSDTLYEDAMIAATAKIHGLTVVTRNVADFHALGVQVLNPFEPR